MVVNEQALFSMKRLRFWLIWLAGLVILEALLGIFSGVFKGFSIGLLAEIALTITISILVLRYANRIKRLLDAPNPDAMYLNAVMAELSIWRFIGIVIIIALCFILISFLLLFSQKPSYDIWMLLK